MQTVNWCLLGKSHLVHFHSLCVYVCIFCIGIPLICVDAGKVSLLKKLRQHCGTECDLRFSDLYVPEVGV